MTHRLEHEDPYKDVDWENEDNLPPSALLNNLLGLLIAVFCVLCAGVGAIIAAANDDSTLTGAIIGGVIGVVLAIAFVLVQVTRLRSKGR